VRRLGLHHHVRDIKLRWGCGGVGEGLFTAQRVPDPKTSGIGLDVTEMGIEGPRRRVGNEAGARLRGGREAAAGIRNRNYNDQARWGREPWDLGQMECLARSHLRSRSQAKAEGYLYLDGGRRRPRATGATGVVRHGRRFEILRRESGTSRRKTASGKRRAHARPTSTRDGCFHAAKERDAQGPRIGGVPGARDERSGRRRES